MNLTPPLTLQFVLTAAKTTNDMDLHADFVDENREGALTKEASVRASSNGTTVITLISAPPQDFIRKPVRISIYNKDTADKIGILQTTDGTTVDIIWRMTITTLKSVLWERGTQWQINI